MVEEKLFLDVTKGGSGEGEKRACEKLEKGQMRGELDRKARRRGKYHSLAKDIVRKRGFSRGGK